MRFRKPTSAIDKQPSPEVLPQVVQKELDQQISRKNGNDLKMEADY